MTTPTPRDPGRPDTPRRLRTPEQERRRARRVDRAIAWLVAAAAALACFTAGFLIGDAGDSPPQVWCCRVLPEDARVSTPPTTPAVTTTIVPSDG